MKQVTLIDCGSTKTHDIASILGDCGCAVRTVPLKAANQQAFGGAVAVVVSGGPLLFTSPTDAEALAGRFEFIGSLRVPCLGICLGHQAIGIRRGARVYLGEERRAEERLCVDTEHPLFQGFSETATLQEDHCEGIELPAGFRCLASSHAYPVEAMADDEAKLYGVQFHPEVSGPPGVRLLENFVNLLC